MGGGEEGGDGIAGLKQLLFSSSPLPSLPDLKIGSSSGQLKSPSEPMAAPAKILTWILGPLDVVSEPALFLGKGMML